ncbi:craniofacial development protein 2 [Culex quinquefasciatus]|uniref:Craniofacial development protein 2 n=1 Tax=Culex quinquefasciatus TaxID=7176 RepID=B0XFG1_CULQU|nr:craniofacial development protein 2 [Culex quinquefasciatus]|eukprot:XP_001868383.1 craniofacial development protein 2 [Culex quinquefasciatus]
MAKRVIGWWPVNDRMCRLRIKGRFFNLSIINVHSPPMGSDADDKNAFYELLDRSTGSVQNTTSRLSSATQVGQEEDRLLGDIIDVRTYRGADIDSDHYLVEAKLRQRLSEVNKIRYRRPKR